MLRRCAEWRRDRRERTVRPPRPRTSTANPDKSTVQSKATPGDGSTELAGPIGIKGESATATPTATKAPRNTAQIGPSVTSAAIVGLSAPRDRSTPRSPRLANNCRLMA